MRRVKRNSRLKLRFTSNPDTCSTGQTCSPCCVLRTELHTQTTMKRIRLPSSSEDSDNESNSTCWSQHSSQHSSQPRRGTGHKPSEVFRTDLITAMKVHDSSQLSTEDYYVLADQWRQDWEKGVQVPVSPQSIPEPVARALGEKGKELMFVKPKKLIRTSGAEALGYVDIRTLAEGMCRYDLNEEDVAWLQNINQEFAEMAMPQLDEITMERVIEELEHRCHENMTHATETEEGLGIEYDEDVVCDVCRSPDGEDNNEMVFCDKCNICVHQACYGIQKVPKGSWLCRICALGIMPKCQLCPKKGGAMKPTRSGTKWVHVSCALWIPEVSIGNPEKMEPITNVSHIPSNRWALICCLCKEKRGACIQCSAKNCRTAFHVTCGLHAGLEMNTILTEDDEVKFKSYCPKHSGLEGAESRDGDSGDEEEKEGARDKKGRRRGRSVQRGGGPQQPAAGEQSQPPQAEAAGDGGGVLPVCGVEEVASHLKLLPEVVDFLFQYWKLKRKANFNLPLLTPKKDEEESLARREQEVLLRRLQLFTHLRQDLERVRNLTYMVTRREKMKRSLWRVQEQIFQQQVKLLDHELLTGDPSAKDLEEIFSLGSKSRSSWSHSGLKPKQGSVKQERRRSTDRRSFSDSSHSHKKENLSKQPETRDGRSSRIKEAAGDAHIQNSDITQEVLLPKLQEAIAVKLHKPESRKGPRREAPGPEPEALTRGKRDNDHEQEEKRRRRRSEVVAENLSSQVKNSSGPSIWRKPFPSGWWTSEARTPTTSSSTKGGGGRGGGGAGKPLLRPLTNTPEPTYARTRLRTGGAEHDGYASDSKPSEGEEEPCLKRCHSHQLRGDSSLSRRYGSDIIRRGVLAS
ncbi:unnamed protein product [Pleuronectes platessa]|uniref:Protein Jade-1 n=1 Tax=Pleuronectes platessa TaxID=8262 RepID=A0A9N7VWD4_PLEPL|nr:unnamed protein product [Pleuronectes platessa]